MRVSRAKINNKLTSAEWIKVKIKRFKGRRIRVLIYARYSTEEQNPRSIEAQVDLCKAFLHDLGAADADITVVTDPAISGEFYSRPGINQVRDGILAGRWDLIIVEDGSRLFRNEQFCFELVGQAVDRDIRVICINDLVDTADDEDVWVARLHEACQHHQSANRYTRSRVKRAMQLLWAMGAAIGLLKPGYARKASMPATLREPERGPFYDEIDLRWAPVIVEAFERIAGHESPYLVAERLTAYGLPKTPNSTLTEWTEENVKDLIRRPDYVGLQEYRRTVSKKQRTTGKHIAKRNDKDKVWTREAPHLRIISDELRARAIAAIQARDRTNKCRKEPNRQAGVPRNSRGPLSGIFHCRCGRKMQLDGHYRCSGAIKKRVCWNKARALRDLTHEMIRGAIFENFPRIRATIEQRLPEVAQMLGDGNRRDERRAEFSERAQDCQNIMDRLLKAYEKAEQDAELPELLVKRLGELEDELAAIQAEQQLLERRVTLPTMSDIEQRISEIRYGIGNMDRGARDVLSQIISPVEAFPCQQFGSDKVVLRARFAIRVAGFLPPAASWPLDGVTGVSLDELFGTIPVVVNLFLPSTGPEWWSKALALAGQGIGLTEIGKQLGIGKRRAHIAKQYGEELRRAGLSDPFTELTEAPKAASRWRSRRRQQAGPATDTDAPAT